MLICFSNSVKAAAQTVEISDPNLRAAIETALSKASGNPITAAEMETLTFLDAGDRQIRVLTGLESATNLTFLFLLDNSISDLTPLAGLTNLRFLGLENNSVSDLSPVVGLTNLIFLGLQNNSVSDLSPLVGNTGLGAKDTVNVMGNPLSYPSLHTHIPALQAREVEVFFDSRTPTTLLKISGEDQEGVTGEALMQPFIIEVWDENGLAFEGVPVMFTATEGGGTLHPEITMTDADGRAESLLMLGTDPGTNTVEVSVEGIAETVIFNAIAELLEFDLSLPAGLSLIHIPLKVRAVDGEAQTIESVGNLYDALGGAETVNFLITYAPATQAWFAYFGPPDRDTPVDRGLTDATGILAFMKTGVSVSFGGDALGTDGISTITLNQGLNLVGLPLKDSRVTRVSDLFALEGIADKVPVVIVTDNGEFKVVGRAGDPGDIEITGGQAFILIAQQETTVALSGEGWDNTAAGTMAAPLMMRGIQPTGITPVLALSGSIVDGVRGINSAGLRVSVKNLSTGSVVAAMIEETGDTPWQAGYRLTVVDIKGGRAAAIGDTLEISVKSPDTSIGVQPLRYTVTPEDVGRSRIQLPALVLQEIPAETELLRNYPNPFNPETWIPYQLDAAAEVKLTIYDVKGELVRRLDLGYQQPGYYTDRAKAAYWDGRNEVGERVVSGVFFYQLRAGDYSATRRMVILK